jgi:very-short-patch-repair endonuclease
MCFHPTATEALLFSAIRGKRLGVAFRRQQIIGNHIVDFLAREISLVVKVDGDFYHAQRVSADVARERKLVRAGYPVVRVPASLVQNNLAGAVAVVQNAVSLAKAAS